jgi:hypothetical protein
MSKNIYVSNINIVGDNGEVKANIKHENESLILPADTKYGLIGLTLNQPISN